MDRGQKGKHAPTAKTGKVEKVDAQGRHAHGQFRGAMDRRQKGEYSPTVRKIEEIVASHSTGTHSVSSRGQFKGAMDRM